MEHPSCPHCQQDECVIKSGLNHTGSQRYRCQQGRRHFTPDPKPEGYDVSVRIRALKFYLEGTNCRAIGRILGLHHQTESPLDHASCQRLAGTDYRCHSRRVH